MKKSKFTLLVTIVALSTIVLITPLLIYKIRNNDILNSFKNKMFAVEEISITYNENLMVECKEDVTIKALDDKHCRKKIRSNKMINLLSIKDAFSYYLLDSSSNDIGTNDILTAIQKLSSEVSELKKLNQELTTSNVELKNAIKDMNNNEIGTENALNKIYPVGSIYISTNLKTAEEVKENLGGEWESYGTDRVLRGTTGEANQTGGNSNVSLTTANLPSHSHSYTPAGTITSTFTGTAVNSGSTGSGYSIGYGYSARATAAESANHTHNFSGTTSSEVNYNVQYGLSYLREAAGAPNQGIGRGTATAPYALATVDGGRHYHTYSGTTSGISVNHAHSYNDYYANSISGVASHYHSVTAKGTVTSTFTGTASNTDSTGSNTSFSVLDPYITVYMYKRIG